MVSVDASDPITSRIESKDTQKITIDCWEEEVAQYLEKEERTSRIQSLTVAKKYHPVWFLRMEDGYMGTNTEDALVFCARQVDMMIPCP